MKKLITYLIAWLSVTLTAFGPVLLYTSCNTYDDEQLEMGYLQFGIDTTGSDGVVLASSAVISVSNEDSSVVVSQKRLNIHLTDDGYITEELEVLEGVYNIHSIEVFDYSGELVLLVPKAGTVAASQTGDAIPQQVRLEGTQGQKIPVRAYSPRYLNIPPEDFGYHGYGQWRHLPPPISDKICLRIGVAGPYDPIEPISFQVFSKDSIVLYGKCSKGITEFSVPMNESGYIIQSITRTGVETQEFTALQMARFSCKDPSGAFINLIPFDPNEGQPKTELLFIRQQWMYGDLEAEVTLIDTEGTVFKARSERIIHDSLITGVAYFDAVDYDYYKTLMVNKVGKMEKDSLVAQHKEAQKLQPSPLPKEHRGILHNRLYAIFPDIDGRFKAVQVNWWYEEEPQIDMPPPLNGITDWFHRYYVFQKDKFRNAMPQEGWDSVPLDGNGPLGGW